VDVNGHNRDLSPDREYEWRILEGQKLTSTRAGSLREHNYGHASPDGKRRPIVCLEGASLDYAVDADVTCCQESSPKHRDSRELLLADEPDRSREY